MDKDIYNKINNLIPTIEKECNELAYVHDIGFVTSIYPGNIRKIESFQVTVQEGSKITRGIKKILKKYDIQQYFEKYCNFIDEGDLHYYQFYFEKEYLN